MSQKNNDTNIPQNENTCKLALIACRRSKQSSIPINAWIHLAAFACRWYSDVVFEDMRPRKLKEIFTQPEAREIRLSHQGTPFVSNLQL
ncbi:MAG TPA: hypothetical protein VKA91_09205 [Nitrososphaeraceae archaeon]|nr:hypothetical protein [Nitrososphaeraceae archaeon]